MRAILGFKPRRPETVARSSARGLRIGAISKAEHDGLRQNSVARMVFSNYLYPGVTSARAKWRKLNLRIFEYATQEWKMNSNGIVMAGDSSLEDIAGAHRAGMRATLIQHVERWRSRNQFQDVNGKPDATVTTLAEIPAIIERL